MIYDVTSVVSGLVAICAALITGVLVPWLSAKTGLKRTENLTAWTKIAVAAAEQIYQSAQGDEKKTHALEFLEAKGLHVSEEELDRAIEAAVLELHQGLKEVNS